jgi:hypothetical protein
MAECSPLAGITSSPKGSLKQTFNLLPVVAGYTCCVLRWNRFPAVHAEVVQ